MKIRTKKKLKQFTALLLSSVMIASALAAPAYAVVSWSDPDTQAGVCLTDMQWTWSLEGEADALVHDLIPTGLSQQQTDIMGGYTTKFWFQNKNAKTVKVDHNGQNIEIDFSKFNHRYYACADAHTSAHFAQPGSQMVFKRMYFPTEDMNDYPEFIQNAPLDIQQRKFLLLMISMLSAAYDTPSSDDLKDSDKTSMYYYLLWLSVWANDKYAEHGLFHGNTPEDDWDYVRDQLRFGLEPRLNPDVWGSSAMYNAFGDGGAAQKYFFNCWKAAKFLSTLDYATDIGTSLPVAEPAMGDDGMYHMTFDYSALTDYEKEVYRRLTADNLADGWEYTNDGGMIDFKSADGKTTGNAVAVLHLQENSEEDSFNNCGFGMGGLAGFQGCARTWEKADERYWGNTQIYFCAVSEPLEILVGGKTGGGDDPNGNYEVKVDRYEHKEEWQTNYNVQLRKYDSETGQPLEGSKWDVLEAFDAGQLDGTDLESSDNWANKNGSQFKKWDGWDYGDGNLDGDSVNDPCTMDVNITGADGILYLGDTDDKATETAAHTDRKNYTYNKGYCGGHPEPVIEESGDPEIDAQLETDAQEEWERQVAVCEALAAEGGFFHSIGEGEGKAALEADRDDYYEQFISLKYQYSAVELEPRPGYTVHGNHTDDIPIEIKTVTASEYKNHAAKGRNLVHETESELNAANLAAASTPSVALRAVHVLHVRDTEGTRDGAEITDATPSDASPSDASKSNADKKTLLTKLKELFEDPRSLVYKKLEINLLAVAPGDDEDSVSVSFKESEAAPVVQGRSDIVDHTFIVYDHRTEGEVHINKRDLDLKAGQKEDGYGAYGDSQGDGTLEGAVYGLFAANVITHPDGKSGTVYQKNDLVAVASTDKNGDASFLTMTEGPGLTYNYKTGQIEKRPEGFDGPLNLHRGKEGADAVPDMEKYVGHDSAGNAVHPTDSTGGAGDVYQKLSSNQPGIEGLEGNGAVYPIRNNEAVNGNCWIGRPLFVEENGTSYYVKELTRSEGYELSVNGKTNAITNGQDNYEQEYASPTVTPGRITANEEKNANYFDIKAWNVDHDVVLKGINFPKGAAFEISTIVEVPEKITVPVYTTVQKPVMAVPGAYVYRDGKRMEADLHDTVTFPNGQTYTVNAVSARQDKTIGVRPMNYHTLGTPAVTDLHSAGQAAAFMDLYNKELDKSGYKEPSGEAPWVRIRLQGTTDLEWITSITKAMKDHDLLYFNSLRITDMEVSGGDQYAIMRYEWNLYGDSRDNGVYVPDTDTLYVKKDTGNGYFVYAAYETLASNPAVLSAEMKDGFLSRASLKDQSVSGLTAAYPAALPDKYTMVTEQTPAYWVYAAGEQQLDDAGNLKYTEEVKVDYVEQDGTKLVEQIVKLDAVYDEAEKTYKVTLPAHVFEAADTVSLKVSDDGGGSYGYNQAFMNGAYFAVMPLDQLEDSYIANVLLTRPDMEIPVQDGGTREIPAEVLERSIKQKIKVVKDISVNGEGKYPNNSFAGSGHEDGYTQGAGGKDNNAKYLSNFRFKTYLKSNLERLYRAEDGTVVWQDRNGNTVNVLEENKKFPEKVQKLYTKVLHRTDPLVRDTNKAAMANAQLYGCTGGLINADQNSGYSSVLETVSQTVKDAAGDDRTVDRYNYEKFFDAVNVANSDKWDRTDDKSTSFKPFGTVKALLFGTGGAQKDYPAGHNNPEIRNTANTSDQAKDSTLRSDHIRQFAITWYLDSEVEKLVKPNQAGETESEAGGESYQEEIYDTALAEAVKKAENYLKPFFSYDLDEIYAIRWDSEAGGGKDKDMTTLSADLEDADGKYCCGISEYLPYGIYVAVEQQPWSKDWNDLYNKHYKTDAPKEIELPAVYEDGKTGADQMPEKLSGYYDYNAASPAADLSAKFFIRFNEEWPGERGDDLRKYVIRAHGCYGDYEIYKYGLDLDKLDGTAAGDPSGNGHFKITQSPMDPAKDYYNIAVDPEEKGGNPDSHYLADDRNKGNIAPNGTEYGEDVIEKIYHYGSVSENRQVYDDVSYPLGQGEEYRDKAAAMEGMLTAYDGKYAPMLVPWTVTEPAGGLAGIASHASGKASYAGYAYRKYRNTFYTGKLRIEKLDSETGENILHDGAVFALYAADREDGQDTDGLVKFYEKETLIKGSREFLEAMGAARITPAARALPLPGGLWTGYVPAQTPVCSEAGQVVLTDGEGRRTGRFEAFTTTRDGQMADEDNAAILKDQDQNAGYLVTPQPLGAGTYVLCEIKPPAGYVRTKPVAIEIYSDQVSYYLDGDRDNRVTAAIYQDQTGLAGSEPGKVENTARIYVGNTPVRLEISKIKTPEQAAVYRTDTRLEGTLTQLKAKYGGENLEYGYKNGRYLGYAWPKGTLEYLENRKAAGEAVETVYIDGVFAGYGLINRKLDTADDVNRYAAGARMTMYDAMEVKQNGDSQDYGYDGVKVERDRNNNVQSIKVLKGYAGATVEFIRKEEVEDSLAGGAGEGTWTYQTVEREDTDILFYSLAGLKVSEIGTDGKIYGYDRNGQKVLVKNQSSIYAMKNGRPEFEITGGDLEKIRYSALDKRFTGVSPETVIYHLDGVGNRDAMVDPAAGMAYVIPKAAADKRGISRVLVWPVKVSERAGGAVIAREKIPTWRIASVNADTEDEYTVGTYNGRGLDKTVNPVVNGHGLPEYYQISGETYTKGKPVYDIDGDYVRYKYDDLLPAYNDAAYRVDDRDGMENIGQEENTADDKKLYHRQGEAWIMENTWTTGEAYPNDPFKDNMTVGQADMLKRVIPGVYIMEELEAPTGYVKGFPAGITVEETARVQNAEMIDDKIKVEIAKTDAASRYQLNIRGDCQKDLTVTEPKGVYGYGQIAGAHLALYKAKRVYSADYGTYPKGYYLEKAENTPARWTAENTADNVPIEVVADWTTGKTPKYFEGIPAGDYILQELDVGGGYVRCSMDLEIKRTERLQTFNLKDDHTKLEIYKYYRDESGAAVPMPNSHAAGLALYEAETDGNGAIVMDDGLPRYDETRRIDGWSTDDLKDYTEAYTSAEKKGRTGSFLTVFENAYREKSTDLVSLTWETREGKRFASRTGISQTARGEGVAETWTTDTGKTVRITIYQNLGNGSLSEAGNLPLQFEYQFNYRELPGGVKSYDTAEAVHRIDYLPFNAAKDGKKVGNYVLVEERVPEGFEKPDPKAVVISETGDVQRYSMENIEKFVEILKVIADEKKEYSVAGVKLALYRADSAGNFAGDEEHLMEGWVSGSDGTYTEEDKFNGKIPAGMKPGDLRPHRIGKVPYGVYYVAEQEVLAHMVKGDPVKLEVGASTAVLIRITNRLSRGRLEIQKTAADTAELLENARFLVENKNTGETFYMTTGKDGLAVLSGLLVGAVKTDGSITPYTYSVQEISPPDLYQTDGGKKFFQFDGNVHTPVVTYTVKVEDKPTKIQFRKTNFDTGMTVDGAKIAVYRAKAAAGEYQKDGNAVETVVCGAEGFVLTKKLLANQVYIMEELEAPAGMYLSAPVIFSINGDGTGISMVDNDFNVLHLRAAGGTIEELIVTGRVANKVYTVLKDLDTGEELSAIAGSPDLSLTAGDGIMDGHLYEITEYTRYSDGNTVMSRRETRRIHLGEDGTYILPLRSYLETGEELAGEDGDVLEAWTVDANQAEHIVVNPVAKERVIAKVAGAAGKDHGATETGDLMKYSVTYENTGNEPADMTVTAVLSDNLRFVRASKPAQVSDGAVSWKLTGVAAHHGGSLELVAAVSGRPGDTVKAEFTEKCGNGESFMTVLENPVVPEGSFTLRNHLSGTGKDPESRFTYQVRFLNAVGDTLAGYQGYSGSLEGRIKGEGTVTLKGEEYITFAGLPYGTRYEISQKENFGYVQTNRRQSGVIAKGIQSAVYENVRNDEARREILTAGKNYRLMETTGYTDGEKFQTGIYRFTLNVSGNIDNLDMEDKPVKLYFSKVDADTGEEIMGGRYTLTDAKTGKVIYEYDKKEHTPARIPAELIKPGNDYLFREKLPPDGYAYEEEIRFTANQGGIPETVIMEDKKTRVYLEKVDSDTGELLAGGQYAVEDPDTGKTVFSYTATGEKVLLEGLLTAGKTYQFVEKEPPAGYAYTRSVTFTVPEKAEDITITMKDKQTEILVEKLAEKLTEPSAQLSSASPSNAALRLAGAVLQILNEDKTPAKAIRSFGTALAGEDLMFTTTEELALIKGQLTAGNNYWLHEVKPQDGYAYAPDVPFTVLREEGRDTVVMTDKPTHAVLSKKALTGSEELEGNCMAVADEAQNVLERWVSGKKPHEIIAELTAGKTYYLCEETPREGYAYGEKVKFTVSLDGQIDQAEMRNEMTKVRINKVDPAGRHIKGAVLQIQNAEKGVVIEDFVSEETPLEITGRLTAGESYYLHEVSAPAGYLISGDVPFTVLKYAGLTEVTMVDEKRESPGTEQKKLKLLKTDAVTGERLAGFTFTVYEPDGEIWAPAVTGKDGYAVFDMPPDGEYCFRETQAAEGYLLSDADYKFTVRDGRVTGDSTLVVADQKIPIKEEKIGTITAGYQTRPGRRLKAVPGGRIPGRKTGDHTPLEGMLALLTASVLGSFAIRRKGGRKRQE